MRSRTRSQAETPVVPVRLFLLVKKREETMSTSKTRDFTEGKILQPLLLFALPVLLALFLQAMYGAVDLMVVGKFGDAADISGFNLVENLVYCLRLLFEIRVGRVDDVLAAKHPVVTYQQMQHDNN